MSALTAAKRAELEAELVVLETRLTALNAAYTSVLGINLDGDFSQFNMESHQKIYTGLNIVLSLLWK